MTESAYYLDRTLRDEFRGYYPPTADELEKLWSSSLIILDANTLLNLYRYSETTSHEFIEVLRALEDRLWLPYQVGLEFQRNRLTVIEERPAAFDSVMRALTDAKKAISSELSRYKKHASSLDADSLVAAYDAAIEPIIGMVSDARDRHRSTAPTSPNVDPTRDAVTEIFSGRIGAPFSGAELAAIYDEGKARYASEVPPGYRDARKGEPDCYGDLVIWKEILRRAGSDGTSVIFVTDDNKEDWWRVVRGQTLGPRVELIDEFSTTTGELIHFYEPEQFLRFAKERVPAAVSEASLGEVKDVSSEKLAEDVRAIVLARRADLVAQRAQLLDSATKVQENLNRGTQLDVARRAQTTLRGEMEVLRQELKSIRLLEDDLVQGASDPDLGHVDRGRALYQMHDAADRRAAVESRIEGLSAELQQLSRYVKSLEEGPVSNPSRLDALRARIDHVDREIALTDDALLQLDDEDR